MDPQRAVVEAFAAELAGVIERMTGEPAQFSISGEETTPSGDCVAWKQQFSPDSAGPAWVAATTEQAIDMGRRILAAAGIGDIDDDGARATYLDLISNAFSTFARPFGQRLGQSVSCAAGIEAGLPGASLLPVDVRYSGTTTRVFVRFENVGVPDAGPASGAAMAVRSPNPAPRAQTLDLLLDVELPVSVSFGSAELPLRDVVKLTAGSVVELNRSLSEPVELIVNNFVVARGEVVVVDGNFAIRVQEVVSRQERLRTAR